MDTEQKKEKRCVNCVKRFRGYGKFDADGKCIACEENTESDRLADIGTFGYDGEPMEIPLDGATKICITKRRQGVDIEVGDQIYINLKHMFMVMEVDPDYMSKESFDISISPLEGVIGEHITLDKEQNMRFFMLMKRGDVRYRNF